VPSAWGILGQQEPPWGNAMTIEPIRVESPFGVTVEQRFHVHEPRSDRLLVVLPGRAYLVSHPVLFHVDQMSYERGWDVLPVQYGFQLGGDLGAGQEPLLAEDVRLATAPALERGYREVCVVGKSLGTPLAMELARTAAAAAAAESVSRILLTPIGTALAPADGIRTLSIIGTADPLYAPGLAVDTATTTWRVFERLDHGLVDEGDWRFSIGSLAAIVAACEEFIG
jgi:hypothetical protein